MSFTFNWNAFAKQEAFQSHIHEMLTNALNKGKPLILEDEIRVVNLDWGREPPSLEMLEIGDVATDRFRGVFKLNYTGGATITVATKVQANPLNVFANGAPSKFVMPDFVAAPVSFPIPLHLTLHNIRLQGTVIVVFSKQGGLTLVFRNDPLQSIEVNSTFDKFAVIASFLQQQIEAQIRNLFREEVPSILYRLSLKYLPSHNPALLGLNSKPHREHTEPVAFASIDSDKPVSIVNILHVGAMLQSRSTLALEAPIMPTAIVRSELHHRASLLAQRQSQLLNMDTNDQSAYDELYIQAKHIGQRSQRKHKCRTIKLHKDNSKVNDVTNSSTSIGPNAAIGESLDMSNRADVAALNENSRSDTEIPQSRRAHTVTTLLRPETHIVGEAASESIPQPAERIVPSYSRISSRGRSAHPPVELVKSRRTSTAGRRFPLHSMVHDAKGFPAFSIRAPAHILVPQAVLHPDLWAVPVQDTDELPPAYVA